jgi:hypothetical protein
MALEHEVPRGVAPAVELDPVDHRVVVRPPPGDGRGDLLGLDDAEVELHFRADAGVGEQGADPVAGHGPGPEGQAELAGKADGSAPARELALDLAVDVSVVGLHLQARARPDDEVGERADDALGVAVVLVLVPSSASG